MSTQMDDLERQLGPALHELIPDYRPRPGLLERVEGMALRRRRRAVAGGTVLVVLLIAVAGLGTMAGRHGGKHRTDPVSAPPAVAQQDRHLFISPASLPPSGGEVAVIMANPTNTAVEYGLGGKLQRWNGTGWRDYRQFDGAIASFNTAGALHGLEADVVVPSIGFQVSAHGYGEPQWVNVRGLSEGFYRFTQDGAGGILQITDGAPEVPLLRPTGKAILQTSTVIKAGAAQYITVRLSLVDPQGVARLSTTVGAFSGSIVIDRLEGQSWIPVTSFSSPAKPTPVIEKFVVRIPSLSAGVYRLTRNSTRSGKLIGVFWVM